MPLKPQIRINPEYASLVPELSPEEFESLKQSIKKANDSLLSDIWATDTNRDSFRLHWNEKGKTMFVLPTLTI